MGRVTRGQAALNRAKVVAAASTLFRRDGLNGVAINEVMAEAGLTHGGFYGQFGSKDALAEEACTLAFDTVEQAWAAAGTSDPDGRLARLAAFYFTPRPPGQDCPMASLAGDVARTPAGGPIRRAFTAGLRHLADMVSGDTAGDKPLVLLAALVGAAVLRRASDDASLSDAMQAAVTRFASGPPPVGAELGQTPREAVEV